MLTYHEFLIGGRWAAAAGDTLVDVISPSTEDLVGRVPEATPADIDTAVAAARDEFDRGPWPRMSVVERGAHLLEVVERLRPRLEAMARTQVNEMGSPYSFARAGTQGILDLVASQVAMVEAIPTRMVRDGSTGRIVVSRTPMGVVASIIPWNAPVPLIVARMLPALLTGSTLVIKPAPESPLSAYLVAEAVIEAGLPAGVLSLVPGGREIGEYLVTHPGVDKVSFTGSTVAGRRVAALCGQNLKPVTLELGGKSAAIVLPDADLDRHLDTIIGSALPNTGQICYATTRILVPRSRSAEITKRFVAAVANLKVGDPHDVRTRFGPLVAERLRDRVEGYIRSGIEDGAMVALGGGRPGHLDRGWYVEPTIFTGVDNSMRVAREEIFGPVVCFIDYDTEADAVAIANDSPYGLGGGVFTDDALHGLDVANRIETGTCVVNTGAPGGGGGPFGGVKESGLGRERGVEGYESYYELRSVALPPGVDVPVTE